MADCAWGYLWPNEAAYFVVIDPDLEKCWATSDGTCPGHPYCADHTAIARQTPGMVASARTLARRPEALPWPSWDEADQMPREDWGRPVETIRTGEGGPL
jgi:hypothetical protein